MATMPMSFSPEQLDQIEKYKQKITELLAEIQKLKNGESGNNSKEKADFSSLTGGGSTDILGLNEDQWKAMFTKTDDLATNIKKIGLAVQVAQQMYAQFYSFQQANMQAELRRYEVNSDRKKKKLKAELDAGYINQETYKNLTLEVEADLERKKQEMVLKKAKQDRIAALFGIATNTALGIMQSVALSPLTGGMPWTAIVGALGALQAAFVLSQPLPEVEGAEDGYYPTIRQQDGKMFNARRKSLRAGLYSEPTVLVGEGNKTELVVDSKTLKRINPTIQQEYMREIQRVKGYETGMIPNSNNSSDEILIKAMQVMENVNQSLETLSKFGVIARWENLYKAVEQIEETKEERNRIIEKNKR
jgi:tubulin-specific chaperone A